MIGVIIVPTGIGAEIGGHAGDANPVVKLFSACCDLVITHPNVVNASDVNELPSNAWYVEGSILDRFLEGTIELKPVHYNKVLVVANPPLLKETINAVSSSRATIGMDVEILELETPLNMIAKMENGCATGDVTGWEELIQQIKHYDFDALAIHTPIIVPKDVALHYYRNGGINPWGGVEAKASKLIADKLNKPVAHAPVESVKSDDKELFQIFKKEIIDPRIAAESISNCYLHCVLKGLHTAPKIGKGTSVDHIDFMVSPLGCMGRPHLACMERNIPVIVVKENKTCLEEKMPDKFIFVDNYVEAAGYVMAMKAGVHPATVRRPLQHTVVKGKQ